MKRFHVHVSVNNLEQSVRFYSSLFGAEPTSLQSDYAKWMLDDPRINFAISQRGGTIGLNHLGLQVESGDELTGMKQQLQAADDGMVEQTGSACCYARSDKYWVTDPSGVAWETFHTLGNIPVFSESVKQAQADAGCCIPLHQEAKPDSDCCIPVKGNAASCCA